MNTVTLRLKRARFWAAVFSLALVAGIWFLTLYHMHQAKELHLQSIKHNLVSVTNAAHAHTERTVQLADQAAMIIIKEYKRLGQNLNIRGLINQGVLSENIFNLFTVVDQNADVSLSSQPFEKVNLAFREHIKIHIDRDDAGLFIGRPVVGRVSGKPSIQFTRRIAHEDGTFDGVVVVSMDPFYFTDVFKSLNLNNSSVISLARNDGLILVRRAGDIESIGADASNSTILHQMVNSPSKIFQSDNSLDDVTRFWTHKHLENAPSLLLTVGVGIEEEMQPFYEIRNQMYLLAGLLSLIVSVFAYAVVGFVQKLDQSRQKAILASQAKTKFLSNISHELRTPLNSILGYTELLELDETEVSRKTFLEYIQKSGKHLLSLVNSLLELSRIEKGEIELRLEQENIRSILKEACNAHARHASEKGLKLTLDVKANVPETFMCDRVKLLQVLHNLINNAIKFTDHGEIQVIACRSGKYICLSIEDTGQGISSEHIETLFDRFFQIEKETTGEQEGFGIGLSIVRQLVQLMGGKVSVRSKLNEGSTFKVYLPEITAIS